MALSVTVWSTCPRPLISICGTIEAEKGMGTPDVRGVASRTDRSCVGGGIPAVVDCTQG